MLVSWKKAASLLLTTALIGSLGSMVLAAETPPPAVAVPEVPAVQVHGYMQNRLYTGSGANLEFRNERISLSTLANLPNDSQAYVEVYYHPYASTSGLYLESAFYDTGLDVGRIRVGKGRRITFGITPVYPNRKTSNYSLLSQAFTQDRIQGVQYYVRQGHIDSGISLHTAYRLGTRGIGEIPGDDTRNPVHSVPELAMRDIPGALSTKPQVSGRLGGVWNGISAGVSGSYAAIDSRDLAALRGENTALLPIDPLTNVRATTPLGATFTSDTMNQIGMDFTYNQPSGFVVQGQWIGSRVSDLDYGGWETLVGWAPPKGWKFFARYSTLSMDTTPTDNPLSWDQQQFTLSAVQPLQKGLWLQYEWEKNMEDTNTGANVKDDLFFVELFTGF